MNRGWRTSELGRGGTRRVKRGERLARVGKRIVSFPMSAFVAFACVVLTFALHMVPRWWHGLKTARRDSVSGQWLAERSRSRSW